MDTKTNEQRNNREEFLELVIVIMLGVTALLTAWASWIGSLHGGNQATNYAASNNLASEGNSEYNAGIQQMNQDMLLWNDINALQIEILYEQEEEDSQVLEKLCQQLFYKLTENMTENMADAIGWNYELSEEDASDPIGTVLTWMENPDNLISPFYDEEFLAAYIQTANDLLAQSDEVLEQGRKDNSNSDAFGLATVIYSVVLFLLGIANSFKSNRNKYAVAGISLAAFIIATVYMITLPMPTGFELLSFFIN